MSLAPGARRAMLATDASGRSLPGCVAKLRPDGRYRGADHVRCTHPSPLPVGYRRCRGDSACPLRLRVREFCPYHEDLIYDLEPHRLYEALTGQSASGHSAARVPARTPWAPL